MHESYKFYFCINIFIISIQTLWSALILLYFRMQKDAISKLQ